MAAADDSDVSGGWTDQEEEDEDQARVFDEEVHQRVAVLEARQAAGDWCQCGVCFPVKDAQSAFDVTCCQESQAAVVVCNQYEEFGDTESYKCVTHHPSFYTNCLYQHQLQNMAHVYNRAGYNPQAHHPNERLRYTAYCSYTVWVHGYLGRRNRREIPHCVMKAIRARFPSPHYTGFQEAPADQ